MPVRRRRALGAALVAALAVWLGSAFMAPAAEGMMSDDGTPTGDVEAADAEPASPALVSTQAAPADAVAGPSGPVPTEPLPACEYGDLPAPLAGMDQWQYTLLDTTFRLDKAYAPPDLVNLANALARAAPGAYLAAESHLLRAEAAAGLAALFEAAEAAGVQLAVQSAYRSYAYQATTFDYWTEQDGYEAALRTSARAGHSEHQLGTAVDLRSRGGPPAWDVDDWAATPEGAWVQANAHLFGFVMSYPAGAEARSCYAYEPWHYRYVGPEVAAQVKGSGEPPRAFLWQHVQMSLAPHDGAPEGQSDDNR